MPANTCPESWTVPASSTKPDATRTVYCALGAGHSGDCVDSNGNPRP